MKKTMRKSALLSSVAMLLVSCIVLTSATYAWFAAARVVSVEKLEAGVQNASGLQIAAVNEIKAYDTLVEKDELEDAEASLIPTTVEKGSPIKPVSTTKSAIVSDTFVTGEFDDDNKISFKETDGGYYRIKVWLKSATDMTVTMKDTKIELGKSAGEVDVKKAVKVAAVYKSTAEGSTATASDFVALDGDATGWSGVAAETSGSRPADSETGAATVTNSTPITPETSLDDIQITLQPEVPVEVDVYVWLEGQDADCTEKMAGATFDVTLIFSDASLES